MRIGVGAASSAPGTFMRSTPTCIHIRRDRQTVLGGVIIGVRHTTLRKAKKIIESLHTSFCCSLHDVKMLRATQHRHGTAVTLRPGRMQGAVVWLRGRCNGGMRGGAHFVDTQPAGICVSEYLRGSFLHQHPQTRAVVRWCEASAAFCIMLRGRGRGQERKAKTNAHGHQA